jgi:hypothetical protein
MVTQDIQSCSPSSTLTLQGAGWVTAQQAGYGSPIVFGAYPDPASVWNRAGTVWNIQLRADNYTILLTTTIMGRTAASPSIVNQYPHGLFR